MASTRVCINSRIFGYLTKRLLSSTPDVTLKDLQSKCRTNESNPVNHDLNLVSLFYTIPKDVTVSLFPHKSLPSAFMRQIETFMETCLMIREPAVEVINYLKQADYSRPAIRYILYGPQGSGKSLSLAHISHYGYEEKFILVHVPWAPCWYRKCKEISISKTKEGFVDIPMDAAQWLLHFKSQNASLLHNLNLTISNEYVWSKREVSSVGTPLLELVDFGISRIKFASDIIVALIKELKINCNNGRCRTLALIDGFNAFLHKNTRLIGEDKNIIPPSKVSVTEAFLEITKSDWINGAAVLTVDQLAAGHDKPHSFLPLYLIEREGFEHLDPFVPIVVPEYSAKEVERCLDYYIDRKWLHNEKAKTEQGRQELAFLSNHNPFNLMSLCAPL